MKQYAISDIHGCARSFRALVKKLNLKREDELYILGDLVNRGPDSKGVLDFIFQLQREDYQVYCLRGNHEQLMLEAGENSYNLNQWIANGGDQTLGSFSADTISEIPSRYINFIRDLPYFYELDDFILVHAGLNFELPDPMEGKHSMLWIRDWYNDIDEEWLDGQVIVHGHNPKKRDELEAQLANVDNVPAINIDNGCVVEEAGKHHLLALDLQQLKFIFQPSVD